MSTLIAKQDTGTNGLRDVPDEPAHPRFGGVGRFVPIAIVIVLLIIGGMMFRKWRATASTADHLEYRVASVNKGSVSKTVSTTGTLEPWTTVSIKSKAGGRVDSLLVDVGSVVKKNQIIARIDPTDTQAAVRTAQAAIDGAEAHAQQAQATYQLTEQQTQNAIQTAQASLTAAMAARAASAAQLASAQNAASAQPKQTAAAIAQAKANYNEATRNREALNATNPQDKASAQSALDQATANEKAAKAALDRQQALLAKGFVAQQTVDTAQAAYDVAVATTASAQKKVSTLGSQQQSAISAADARVAAARAALQNAQANTVDITTKQNAVAQAQAALKQADAQVASAQLALNLARENTANNAVKGYDVAYQKTQITANQATLDNAKETLTQTVVRAPSDGVITTKTVSEGTYITSGISQNSDGTSIVEMADLSRMYVQATVDETDIASVKEGQAVDVRFDAYPNIAFGGKVIRVEPLAVVNSNVTQFNVRVEIDNKTPDYKLLKPGMNATCDFVVAEKDDVVTVPSAAIQKNGQGIGMVTVATGGKPAPADPATGLPADPNTLTGVKVHRVPVQTGLVGNSTTEITGGLNPGDRVVLQVINPAATATGTQSTQAKSPFGNGGPGGPPPGGMGGGMRGGGGGRR